MAKRYYRSNIDVNVWSIEATPQYWDECDENGNILPPSETIEDFDDNLIYSIDDLVYFPAGTTTIYKSLIDNNSWSPTAYPQGWSVV